MYICRSTRPLLLTADNMVLYDIEIWLPEYKGPCAVGNLTFGIKQECSGFVLFATGTGGEGCVYLLDLRQKFGFTAIYSDWQLCWETIILLKKLEEQC